MLKVSIAELFRSVFEGCAKSFSANLCLIRTNLDMTGSTMSLSCVILASNYVTCDTFNYVFGISTAISFVIHILLHSAIWLKFERYTLTIIINRFTHLIQ